MRVALLISLSSFAIQASAQGILIEETEFDAEAGYFIPIIDAPIAEGSGLYRIYEVRELYYDDVGVRHACAGLL